MSEEDKLIPPPTNPSAPPKWLADLINSAAQKSADFMKVPGQIAQGVTPEVPGQWSETDQMRQDSLDNKSYSWGPQAAFSEVFWPRLGRNIGGSGFSVGSGATGGEGNIIPFPKQGGQQSTPKSTMDMLRELFSSEPARAEGSSATVTPFTPALVAKQQEAKQQAAVAEQYRNPTPTGEPLDPKVAASKEMAKQNWGVRPLTPEVQAEKDMQAQGFWFTKPDVNPQTKNMRQDFFVPEGSRKEHPFNFEMETNPHTGNTLVRTNIQDKDRTLAVDIPFGSRQEALDGVKGLFSGEKPPGFLDMFKYAYQQRQNMGVKLGKDVLK